MSRCEQLKKLSQEHEESLLMAERISVIVKEGSRSGLSDGIEIIKKYNDREMEAHLQHEEQTIFSPLIQQHNEYRELCINLGKEHGLLRTLVEKVTLETAKNDLDDFARVLKAHTLKEENELFPVLASVFTDEQLDRIVNFVPLVPEQQEAARKL